MLDDENEKKFIKWQDNRRTKRLITLVTHFNSNQIEYKCKKQTSKPCGSRVLKWNSTAPDL